jgi:hemerythrin-like domain-containing protein
VSDYCCFFLDDDDHVRDIAPHVNCPDDAEAVRVAEKLLAEKVPSDLRRLAAVEVCDSTRRVARRARIDHSAAADFKESGRDKAATDRADTDPLTLENDREESRRGITNDFIEGLRREHRNIASLLHVLEQELAVFDRGDQPDYEIVRAVIDYFKEYPDSCHHPREDMVFEKLGARDPVAVGTIGDLGAAHREGNQRLRLVAETVDGVLADQELPRQAVGDIIRDFIDHERRHIAMEERLFFPAALNALRPEDWVELALRRAGRPDPFGQMDFEQKFNTLRRNILKMEEEADAARPAPPP